MCDKENICEIIIFFLICLWVIGRYVVLIYFVSFNYVFLVIFVLLEFEMRGKKFENSYIILNNL